MGMFDSVFVDCPKCGKMIEFQSKGGDCELRRYHSRSVPPDIALSLDGSKDHCDCGAVVVLKHPNPNTRVEMLVIVQGNIANWD